ncbi:MAG: ribbon-helix-helix protein, CopG family [Nitrososphaerota archaeon]|nr:ribbon-helix-helix protein, CopG family [Nitrososphaerota archaeon]
MTKEQRVTIRLDAKQATALARARAEKSLNVSAFIRRAIQNELAKEVDEK